MKNSKRLGHADTLTTAEYYRLKPTVVTPLSFHESVKNSSKQ